MTTDLTSFDVSPWVGRTTRTRVRATRETVELLESSLDRAAPAPDAPIAPLRHWLWFFAPPAVPTSQLGADGHSPRGELAPEWPLPRRMWAASDVRFLQPVPADAWLVRESVLESATVKSGRSGTLGFVVLRHRWTLEDGRVAIDDAQTAVYREADGAAPAAPAAAAPPPADAPAPAWETVHRPGPELLFRDSALTFHSHRIRSALPSAERSARNTLVLPASPSPTRNSVIRVFTAPSSRACPNSMHFSPPWAAISCGGDQ
ncbi:MAG: MaoC family dehydratase N-terminal domain-containing protein, partial [Burkholderiales bacterium]